MRLLYIRPEQGCAMLADHTNPYLVATHSDGTLDTIKRHYLSKHNRRHATVDNINKQQNTTKQEDEYTKKQLEKKEKWDKLLDRGENTHNGRLALLQNDNYYRCHYLHEDSLYTCISDIRPITTNAFCRIEPEEGRRHNDWNKLKTIWVPKVSDNVLWDTMYMQQTDANKKQRALLRKQDFEKWTHRREKIALARFNGSQ